MSNQQSPPPDSSENVPARRRRNPGQRGPGHRANLTRQVILAAAADLDPAKLTLQAVADSLGVDRKAVTYHISKREELLALMGAEALAAQLEDLVLPKTDWKAAVRVFAVGTRDALLRERTLGIYVTQVSTWALMKPAEQLAEILLDAGFGDDATGRALALITAVAHESARAQLLTDQFGEHPSRVEILRVLDELPEGELPVLRRILPELRVLEADRLDFDLTILIAGFEAWLAQHP
ncbi:TetR/AcrR family transcriptional regulator C-terminal domain-containing protein [Nocardia noduli]|uniref:TetR/AcrR family transcriptional regulator C-terminal domain-containing protein n=1 Tax=Nocardia noduli TaxID=2815722 RepID=UPI001C228E51|nr:TetR/AcrR family transcriptional regulator C-terminal domain-containing protein [Nocardia noduli]